MFKLKRVFIKSVLKKKNFLVIFGITVLLILATFLVLVKKNDLSESGAKLCGQRKCNVVLIFVDTLSAEHLSGYGYFRETSPFADKLFVNNGLVFRNAISNSTWTIPSFASMFKSRMPSDITAKQMFDKRDNDDFVDFLRGAGIDIKAVLRNQPSIVDQTVDSRFRDEEILQASKEKTFQKSSEWIEQRAKNKDEKPFFMLIHDWDVHHPYDPPEPYRYMFTDNRDYKGAVDQPDFYAYKINPEKEGKEKLDRMILQYDQGIRKTDDYLKSFIEGFDEDLKKNTIFIFTSDHGEGFARHDNFVGHAFTPYQEIIHVPLAIVLPNGEKKDIKSNVSLLDLAPTILDIFGIQKPESFLGQSLFSLVNQNKSRFVKSEFGQSLWMQNEEGLFPEDEGENLPIMTIDMVSGTVGKWKVVNIEGKRLELFNLETDPNEQTNLLDTVDNLEDADRLQIKEIFDNLKIKY